MTMAKRGHVHKRTDFQYCVVKGRGTFSKAAYACVITQSTAYPDQRSIYHIECFYGHDGVKARAEARRYGSEICNGFRGVVGYRNDYLPHNFPRDGIPCRERDIAIRD